MHVEVLPDAAAAARRAASLIAEQAHAAVRDRGRFLLALSGGRTPLAMYAALARLPLAWARVELFQTDERLVPVSNPARNWTAIARALLAGNGVMPERTHPMPCDAADPREAAMEYAETLGVLAGSPPEFDLIHLGLGDDGHVASLFADDAALAVEHAWVTTTDVHRGHRRMTLTLPVLARARCVLWLVCGAAKASMLARLVDGDERLPAGRVPRERAWVVADESAGQALKATSR